MVVLVIMAVTVQWDDEANNIIRWDYDSSWTWEEAFKAATQTYTMRGALPEKTLVVVIMNMEKISITPRDSLRGMNRLLQLIDPRDSVIVVGSNTAVNIMVALLRAIVSKVGKPILTMPNMNEARFAAARLLNPGMDAPTEPSRTIPPEDT
jgi:hypothetical protein